VTVARQKKESRLGRGSAFSKGAFGRLRRANDTWEADFRALPTPMTQSETRYLGIVVSKDGGSVLARTQIDGRPTVDDLSALLADAMRRPLVGETHRPRLLHLRGHRQWRELLPDRRRML
jgi:hypothetical protein